MDIALRLGLGAFRLDVALSIPEQGVTAIFGPSGCGKTTLLRCLAGLERAPVGRVALAGQSWQDEGRGLFVPAHRRPVGMVFQDAALLEHLDVRANVAFGWRRLPPAERRVSLEQAVAWSGIEALLGRMPRRLSGGERQRVALARALAVSPRLLLMDEPLAALDVRSREAIMPALQRLAARPDVPIVYVSHSVAEVARLADHVVLMDAGAVVAAGPVGELLARLDLPLPPGEDAGVVLQGRVGERDLPWALARLDVPGASFWCRDPGLEPGTAVRLRVPARDVSLALGPFEASSIQNQLPAVVEDLAADAQHPAQLLVRLRTVPAGPAAAGVPLLARVTRRAAHALALAPGQRVWAMVKSVALFE